MSNNEEDIKYYKVLDDLGVLKEGLSLSDDAPRTVRIGAREVVYESGKQEEFISFRLLQATGRCQAAFVVSKEDLVRILGMDLR